MRLFLMMVLIFSVFNLSAQENGPVENELNQYMMIEISTLIHKIFAEHVEHYNTVISKDPKIFISKMTNKSEREIFEKIYADVKSLPELEVIDNRAYLKTKDARVSFDAIDLLLKNISINGKEVSLSESKSYSESALRLLEAINSTNEQKMGILKRILNQLIQSAHAMPQNLPMASPYGPNGLYIQGEYASNQVAGLQRYIDSTNRNNADFQIMRMAFMTQMGATDAGIDMDLAETSDEEQALVRRNITLLATGLRLKRDECQRDLAIMQRTGRSADEFTSIRGLVTMLNRYIYAGVPDWDKEDLRRFLGDAFMNTAPWCRDNTNDYYEGHPLYRTFGRLWHDDVCRPFSQLKQCLEIARLRSSSYDNPVRVRPLLPMLPPLHRETMTIDQVGR